MQSDLLSLWRHHEQDVFAVDGLLFPRFRQRLVIQQGKLQPRNGIKTFPEVRLHGLGISGLSQDLQQLVVG